MALPASFRLPQNYVPQFKIANQFSRETGLDATFRSNEAKCTAQGDRADLGICLINVTSAGDQAAVDRSDEFGTVELASVRNGACELTERLEASRGGLPDPWHGS